MVRWIFKSYSWQRNNQSDLNCLLYIKIHFNQNYTIEDSVGSQEKIILTGSECVGNRYPGVRCHLVYPITNISYDLGTESGELANPEPVCEPCPSSDGMLLLNCWPLLAHHETRPMIQPESSLTLNPQVEYRHIWYCDTGITWGSDPEKSSVVIWNQIGYSLIMPSLDSEWTHLTGTIWYSNLARSMPLPCLAIRGYNYFSRANSFPIKLVLQPTLLRRTDWSEPRLLCCLATNQDPPSRPT